MKKFTMVLVVVGVMAFGISAAMGMHHAIKIQEKDGIGKYLTDTEGNTLYWFKKDSPGKKRLYRPLFRKMAHILQRNGCRPQRNKGRGFWDDYQRGW